MAGWKVSYSAEKMVVLLVEKKADELAALMAALLAV